VKKPLEFNVYSRRGAQQTIYQGTVKTEREATRLVTKLRKQYADEYAWYEAVRP